MTRADSYSTFEPYDPEPKTQVELRMIRASAAIRFAPDWVEQLHSDSKRKEWAVQVKKAFGVNSREVKYIFEELEYYAKLTANGRDGEEPGAIDMTWINREGDVELAREFACNAELLEDDHAKRHIEGMDSNKSSDRQVLVDPFMYAFASDESHVFKKAITTPKDAVDSEFPRIKPRMFWKWEKSIGIYNDYNTHNKEAMFDKRKISALSSERKAKSGDKYASGWLPTDFDIGKDGSVSIRSYINNLHPVRYSELYQTISKVFAKCVPLLEQVLTDAIHPHQSRDIFDEDRCFKYCTLHPHDVIQMVEKGEPLAEKYHKFVTTSDSYCYGGKWNETLVVNGIELDTSALFDEWAKIQPRKSSASALPFSPLYRPTVPYSMRGLPLQASVEMATIALTPDNPNRPESEWQAEGREEEAISAVCLYFYDVENVANARLMFRDPKKEKTSRNFEKKPKLYNANYMADYDKQCRAMKAVGSEEIKAGRFIFSPSLRRVSTEIVPPRQPDWANTDLTLAGVANNMSKSAEDNEKALVALKNALEERDELERKHRAYDYLIYCPCMWHTRLPNVKAPVRNVVSYICHLLGF
ncbi:hypothetical protein IW146_005670 [Coemansia sp. RSA 922]|nr:hypothetical protein IW146_005670 [Coemansia sp. RSA 922]